MKIKKIASSVWKYTFSFRKQKQPFCNIDNLKFEAYLLLVGNVLSAVWRWAYPFIWKEAHSKSNSKHVTIRVTIGRSVQKNFQSFRMKWDNTGRSLNDNWSHRPAVLDIKVKIKNRFQTKLKKNQVFWAAHFINRFFLRKEAIMYCTNDSSINIEKLIFLQISTSKAVSTDLPKSNVIYVPKASCLIRWYKYDTRLIMEMKQNWC